MAQEAKCGVCGRPGEPYTLCPCGKAKTPRGPAEPGPCGGTQEEAAEPWTRAQVLGWKRKAEAYDVLVECCERLSEHQDDGSPLVEAMLDAVIEAKRLREQVKSGGVG